MMTDAKHQTATAVVSCRCLWEPTKRTYPLSLIKNEWADLYGKTCKCSRLQPIILPFRTSSPSPAPSFSFPPVTFPSYPLSASFLYFLSSLIPLLFLSPVPPSFPPPFVNRDERNPGPRPPPASSSLPGIQSQSRGPRLQRPTWERLRAPSPGHSWPLERSQFSKGLALACRVEAASLLLPFQGLGFEGRVLSRS